MSDITNKEKLACVVRELRLYSLAAGLCSPGREGKDERARSGVRSCSLMSLLYRRRLIACWPPTTIPTFRCF